MYGPPPTNAFGRPAALELGTSTIICVSVTSCTRRFPVGRVVLYAISLAPKRIFVVGDGWLSPQKNPEPWIETWMVPCNGPFDGLSDLTTGGVVAPAWSDEARVVAKVPRTSRSAQPRRRNGIERDDS